MSTEVEAKITTTDVSSGVIAFEPVSLETTTTTHVGASSGLMIFSWPAPAHPDPDQPTTTDTANTSSSEVAIGVGVYRPPSRGAVPILPPVERTSSPSILTLLAFDLCRHGPPAADIREVAPVR